MHYLTEEMEKLAEAHFRRSKRYAEFAKTMAEVVDEKKLVETNQPAEKILQLETRVKSLEAEVSRLSRIIQRIEPCR